MIPGKAGTWQRVWPLEPRWPQWLGAFGVGLVGVCAWPYTVDDSYIVARYAQRIARGEGYTWNPGAVTDGVTGPAWLLPGIVASSFGYDPVIAAKVVGLCCSCAAAYLCIAQQRRRAGGRALAWLTALILAAQPSFGGAGSSGLETGAAALALTVAAQAALASASGCTVRPGGALWVCEARLGVAIALMAWLRPELAVACGVLLLVATLRRGWARTWSSWTLAAASALAVCLFRARIGGHLLPLAWYAKAGRLQDGWDYTLRAVLVMTGGLGAAAATFGAARGQPRDRGRAWTLLAHLSAVTLAGGDWMPGFRLLVPAYPQYAVLVAVGAQHAWRRQKAAWRVASIVSVLFACGVPLLDLSLRIPEWRLSGRSRDSVGAALALDLRENSKRVALVDIGFLGYMSGVETIDLAGLTEPEVASFGGGHLAKRVPSIWLQERAPDTLVLHSSLQPTAAGDGRLLRLRGYPVEQRVARFDWVQQSFRVDAIYTYAPGYYYVVMRRLPPSQARSQP